MYCVCYPAASCSDPGIPKNGAKDGTLYVYPHQVTYSCYTGYTLKGQKTISCQNNGKWSSPRPTCEGEPSSAIINSLNCHRLNKDKPVKVNLNNCSILSKICHMKTICSIGESDWHISLFY